MSGPNEDRGSQWSGLPSRVGFGAWGIGGRTDGHTSYGETDDAQSLEAIRAAVAEGIRFFDTSPAYGEGRSERLLGQSSLREEDGVVISTKVGVTSWNAAPDYSPRAVANSLEASLERLNRRCADLVFLHSPPIDQLLESPDIFEGLLDLRRLGLTRSVGVSCKSPADAVEIMRRRDVDCFQVNINMLDVRAVTSGLCEIAEHRGVELVARTPLCFGFLSGAISRDTVFAEGDHRANWPAEQIERWISGAEKSMEITGARVGDESVEAALRFCLSLPGVSSVLPGIVLPAEARVAGKVLRAGALPKEQVRQVLDLNACESFFVVPMQRPGNAAISAEAGVG